MNIESQTRNQAKSSKWYELRAGRITASVMKEAISTKIGSPSLSLIKKICCRRKFRNVATDWGIEHEKPAKDCYFIQNSKNHSNFTVRESGLVIILNGHILVHRLTVLLDVLVVENVALKLNAHILTKIII